MDLELSIVIPAFNEQDNINPLYEELKEVLSGTGRTYEILFVDDGSTDATFSRMEELHTRDPAVKVIKFKKNFGQSAAMKAGFDHAKGRIIVTMDGDLQNDPHDIPALYEKLFSEDYDVVCGWRSRRNDSPLKKVFSKIANGIRIMFTGESIHDSGCSLRAYTRNSVANIELYGELHRYIPAMLIWEGYRVGEMKTNHRERAFGKTKYNWQRLGKGSLDLLVITFWQKYSTRPMHIFGALGFVMGSVGFVIVMYLGLTRLIFGSPLTGRPLFLVGLFLLVLGMQFIALGIIADVLLKVYHGQSGRETYLIEKVVE
jgi:glycosyltransferase involved in cell wall biosynthesis